MPVQPGGMIPEPLRVQQSCGQPAPRRPFRSRLGFPGLCQTAPLAQAVQEASTSAKACASSHAPPSHSSSHPHPVPASCLPPPATSCGVVLLLCSICTLLLRLLIH